MNSTYVKSLNPSCHVVNKKWGPSLEKTQKMIHTLTIYFLNNTKKHVVYVICHTDDVRVPGTKLNFLMTQKLFSWPLFTIINT